MMDHRPIVEQVLPTDCLYGECEHDEGQDCPYVDIEVCATCTAEYEESDLVFLVKWPCDFAPPE